MTDHTRPDKPLAESQLDKLLNEALRPAQPPPDLIQRILDQTEPKLRPRPVLVRIGPQTLAIAAVLCIGLGAGLVIQQWPTERAIELHALLLSEAELETILEQLETASTQIPEPIDDQIELLAMHVELAWSDTAWDGPEDALKNTILQYDLDNLADGMDLF